MSSIPTKQIDGDVAVGRDVSIGGKATVRGSATIGHNLKVEGWLDAKNIKGPNKGLFKTAVQLREAYPGPHDGWWALVAEGLTAEQLNSNLGQVYMADGGAWVAQTNADGSKRLGGNPTVDSSEYMEAVENLTGDIEEVKIDVAANATQIATLRDTTIPAIQQSITAQSQINTTQDADITKLKSDVAANATQIATLRDATIPELDATVATNSEDIKKLKSKVANNETAIGDNNTLIQGIILQKGSPNGLAPLDQNAKVPAANLPGYVDDVIEFNAFVDDVNVQPLSIAKSAEDIGCMVVYDRVKNAFMLAVSSNANLNAETWRDVLRPETVAKTPMATIVGGDEPIKAVAGDFWDINHETKIYSLKTSQFIFYNGWNGSEAYGSTSNAYGRIPDSGKIYTCTSNNQTSRWSGTQLVTIGSDLALGRTASTAFPGDAGANLETAVEIVQNEVYSTSSELNSLKQNIAILPFNGEIEEGYESDDLPETGVYLTTRDNGKYAYFTAHNWGIYDPGMYNTYFHGFGTAREDVIFRKGAELFRYDAERGELVQIGGAAVGNTYNLTVSAKTPDPDEIFYTMENTESKYYAPAAVYANGKAALGLQITFAIAKGVWKIYQYTGTSIEREEIIKQGNWFDLAGVSAGKEAVVNINDLCGDDDYTWSKAAGRLKDFPEYIKPGLVILYRRDSSVTPNTWECKQYVGGIDDYSDTDEKLWHDFGSGGGGITDTTSAIDVSTDDGKAAVPNAGAVADYVGEKAIVSFEEQPDPDNYIFQGINAKGNAVGEAVKIPKSNGIGQVGGSTLNIYPEMQAVSGAFGSKIALRACIKSVSYDGDTPIFGTIKTISILDALTKIVLWSEVKNAPSSASATDFENGFEYDFTDFITSASSKEFLIQATDADGNTKSRQITVTAVDVTCQCLNVLNYNANYALRPGSTDNKSITLYKFPNNVSTNSGIKVTTEMYFNGEWRILGTAIVTDQYSHSVSINPSNVFGNGERLTHGSYPLRVKGIDVNSGVEGNTVYTAIMCIDPSSRVPVISIRYNDNAKGKVRLYDSVSIDVAAYTPGSNTTKVDVIMDGQIIQSLNCDAATSYNVSKQVQGYATDGSKSFDVYGTSGSAESLTLTLIVEGSAIAATAKEDAVFTFDFSTRSNDESNHSIVNNGYEMIVEGCNWNSNGFVKVLGEQVLRIAENVTAEIPYAPFGSSAIEASGMALQMAFSTKSILDKDAKLCECYDPTGGAGFYITGNDIVVELKGGQPSRQHIPFKCNEKITVAIVVEPASKYVTYNERNNGAIVSSTNYSFLKLYVNGEECAAIGYEPGTNAVRQNSTIKCNSVSGEFNLNYIIPYNSYMEWLEAFENHLCKLSDVQAMIAEYDKENILDTGRPSMSLMSANGMPYYVIVADQTTFDNFDYKMNGGTNTSDEFACTLFYYNPQHPECNFKATNVFWRRQGTTSAQRPIKNDRFNLNKKHKKAGIIDKKATVTLLNPDDSTELGRKAILAAKYNKVYVSETGLFVDTITVKVDYSDSSNANDCGVCDMMNATFRSLGNSYLTPAQRAFDGRQILGDGDELTGLQMDHSTKNHPIAVFRATNETLQDAWFHAKGNWKEDKGEQIALGFKDTPGYNLGCLNYGDFIEYFGTPDETLAQTEARFKADATTDTSKVYLISQYCGQDYAFYRYKSGAWTRSTGSMKQIDGKWVIEGDVLNPVSGYELLSYAGMCWWQGVSTIEDMMKPTYQKSSWANKLRPDTGVSVPAWTTYFECMIDDDQLQDDLVSGRKVPYDLFNLLCFLDSCDYSKVGGWQVIWKKNAYKYLSLQSAFAYAAFTDYLAAVDQRAKNMQPMFFLEDGCVVEDGHYIGTNGMHARRMYLNKIYDCDTCNGYDNDGGKDIDPEVDPNKPNDDTIGYENPYMGRGSILFNNIDKQPLCWNTSDPGAVDENMGKNVVTLKSVVSAMRGLSVTVDGKTISPFSPDGAMYYFVEKRLKFWPKVISSYDGERKYIANTGIANLRYFYALHGLGLTSLPRFIEQRWAIRDGYYQVGDFFTNPLTIRMASLSDDSKIYITAAATGYFGIGNDGASNTEPVFLEAGQSHAFTLYAHGQAELRIYQPGRIRKIDLSEQSLANGSLSSLVLCEEIILGGEKHTYNPATGFGSMTGVTLGDMPFLRKLDVSGTTATSIQAAGCPRLEVIDASNTVITECNIAQTAPLTSVKLPDTITKLELVNLPKLGYPGGLELAGIGNVTRLWLDGCPYIDSEKLVNDVAKAGVLKQVRIPGINMTASVETLRALKNLNAVGLNSTGGTYDESGQCSGLIGRWILAELIDDDEFSALSAYFPSLLLHNSQFSYVIYDDTENDPENITNAIEQTGYAYNKAYTAPSHTARLEQMSHAVKATFSTSSKKMICERLSDDDYNKRENDVAIDLTDSSGMGFDILKHVPNHWYKGVNDFKTQQKLAFRSICVDEPISTATKIRRAPVAETIVAEYSALEFATNAIGGKPVYSENAANHVGSVSVDGMKQVRWPGVNNEYLGAMFLDADDNIISVFRMSIYVSDFMAGKDYLYCDVPTNAKTFVFTTPADAGEYGQEVIVVDSSHPEAIEPDWVFRKEFLVGIYGMGQDGLRRARSVSGTKAVVGTGTSTTSGQWTYDANGRCTNLSVPENLNRTRQDCINLCEMRGDGFHAISYEQSKDLANIIMELTGTRDIQALCGRGCGAGYTTGAQTINGININALGNKTVENTASSSGNLMFGIQNFVACNYEWMSGVAVNVLSFKDWKARKCPTDMDSSYPVDAVWHIYDVQTDTERAVQGINATDYCIGRVRHGRFMDTIASKLTSDKTLWNQNYTDVQYYSHAKCRVVAGAGSGAFAFGGLVYASAYYVSAVSLASCGSRLAFSGPIEFVN